MSSEAPRSVWFALLGPPTAWFVALNAGYFMVSWACGSLTGRVLLHGAQLSMLAVSIAAGFAGYRVWRKRGRAWPGETADPDTRTRFLAVLGLLSAGVFSVAILWFWVATAVLDPCEPAPRGPMSPSAQAARVEPPRG